MKEFITIITPTYNRKKEMINLYKSLVNQTYNSFRWLIIDDGSTDKTEEEIQNLSNEKNFPIDYIKKENGGKHTALNVAFENIQTEMFIVVDSDDLLTKEAIETVYKYYQKYKEEDLAGFVFLRGYSQNKSISVEFRKDEFIGNYVKDVQNKQPSGDRAEVFYTREIRDNRFPVFENENFIGEGFFWNKISKKKNMLFVNKIIYICNYLEGGLTKTGRKLRISNPLGGMEHSREFLEKEYSLKLRMKNYLLYMVYYRFA